MTAGRLLNQKDAAALLGIPVRRLRRYTKAGIVPHFRETEKSFPVYPELALIEWQKNLADNVKRGAA